MRLAYVAAAVIVIVVFAVVDGIGTAFSNSKSARAARRR